MKAKPQKRAEARRLRAEVGMPLKRIAAELGVSLSSVSIWTRDIEITEEQRRRNLTVATTARAETWIATNRRRREGYQDEGRAQARLGDPVHQAGCMLYWAEGRKSRNLLGFCNSDIEMVRFMRHFLRGYFDLPDSKFAVSLNVYTNNGLSIAEIEHHWLRALDLPASCLRKHTLDHLPTSSSGQARGRLPYGVCQLRVHSTRVLQHIYGAIQEYAGFERPEWLD